MQQTSYFLTYFKFLFIADVYSSLKILINTGRKNGTKLTEPSKTSEKTMNETLAKQNLQ